MEEISVTRKIDIINIAYDGYEFITYLPEGMRGEHWKEWELEYGEAYKNAKKEMKDEYHQKLIEAENLSDSSN